MTPCSLGRHCANCDKTVIDFRKNDLSQLTNALEEHGKVCGLFTKDQVEHKTNFPTNVFRRFAASIFLAFGLGAFNKESFAQDSYSDTLTIKDVVKEDSTVYFLGEVIETMPIYKNGGEKGLLEFLKNNLIYPKDSIKGKVYVSFTVEKTGKVDDAKIVKSLSTAADNEVLRVVQLLEFIPATQNGRKTRVRYTLPISFNRDK